VDERAFRKAVVVDQRDQFVEQHFEVGATGQVNAIR
jgi:hypothetical protein